ncbi:MAG TPA: iron-sulfur cluster biosynthesis family protein [Actinomycetota bacterium]|nr:iron-sulfur cluster biosynthesis family protein [Actinomycetota bacterium]
MLTITSTAAQAIKAIVSSSELEDGGLRIEARQEMGEATLELSLAGEADPGDAVIDEAGAHVYLEPQAASLLDDKVLDADVKGDEVRFSIGPVQD